ncbi:Uncharacterised protein [Corynebacterium kutscheri]|uniref:Uncharacterized protein n=1 Tax=Corynebacterium kutscheri TaxID=35755 RepID=A0AB38VRL4_9CORY|nr:Uncharacterised protein [Corynebacterium kutscheri]VEH80795.1 Uncharacterised protein [Corynebacterium kutscheri]
MFNGVLVVRCEEQRSLCQYYTTVSLNYQTYVDDSRHQAKAQYFKPLVDKAAEKLYESKYGVESETL